MSEEVITTAPGAEEEVLDHQNYINAIQEMKDKTVDKTLYDKLLRERNDLINTLANGGTLPAGREETATLEECRKAFNGKLSGQCDMFEKLLAMREAGLREEGEDCFVSTGRHITPTQADYQRAQELADIYRECLDYAQGDDGVFVGEMSRRMVDTGIPMVNKSKVNRR